MKKINSRKTVLVFALKLLKTVSQTDKESILLSQMVQVNNSIVVAQGVPPLSKDGVRQQFERSSSTRMISPRNKKMRMKAQFARLKTLVMQEVAMMTRSQTTLHSQTSLEDAIMRLMMTAKAMKFLLV
jgi:hypothetical protein